MSNMQEVVCSEDSMTMVIRIFKEHQSMIKASMLIFMNSSSNYPIRGLEDNILGVCYSTGPRG